MTYKRQQILNQRSLSSVQRGWLISVIAHHKGDVRKALKEMRVLNAHLNDQPERIINARPGREMADEIA
jgi:hypothetical protein